MALKDCMKKLSKALDPEDQELLELYLEQGLSDNEALVRLDLVLDKKILDISLRAKKRGAVVKVRRDALAEVRALSERRRGKLRLELIDIRQEQDNFAIQREEIAWIETNIKYWEPGGAAIDLSNDTQLYMRFEQMGFVHKEAFKRGEFGDGQIKGKDTFELVQSFHAMQDRSAEYLTEIHGLLLREAAVLEELGLNDDRNQVLDENGDYQLGVMAPQSVNEIDVTYTSKAPWKITSSGEGDLYISRHGNKAGTPHKERQGPNDFAISFDESVLLPDFAFYLLTYLQPKIAARAHGTAQQAINKKDIEEVMIQHFRNQVKDPGTVFTDPQVAGEIKILEADANYKALVKTVETGTMAVGTTTVSDAADAAHVVALIRKNAQESMWAIVLDENGNVLSVIEHTKGTTDGTSVFPSVIAGSIHQIEGADSVWFAHNHPSGNMDPSTPDEVITRKMQQVMDGSGIDVKGHVVVGNKSKTFTHIDPQGVSTAPQPMRPMRRGKKVSVSKRVLRGAGKGPVVNSPAIAGDLLARMGHPEGVLLLDNRNIVLGFMAMSPAEMRQLRGTGGSRRLFEAIGKLNANGMIISTKAAEMGAVENMVSFGHLTDIRVIDSMHVDANGAPFSKRSQVPSQMPIAGSTFYQSIIGFTSGLMTAVQTMTREKGTAAEMLGSLRKTTRIKKGKDKGKLVTTYAAGVTKEEMDWLDVEEWAEAKGTVTKQEMIDYVTANGIVVEEATATGEQAYSGQSLEGGTKPRDIFLKLPEVPESTLMHDFDIVSDGIENISDGQADDILTFAATDPRMTGAVISREDSGGDVKLFAENVDETQYDLLLRQLRDGGLEVENEQTTEFRVAEPEPGPGLIENFPAPVYFPHKNIIVWMRTTERVGPNGEKILMVEEVQSKWHQQGGKLGYRGPIKPPPTRDDFSFSGGELTVHKNEFGWFIKDADGKPLQYGRQSEIDAGGATVRIDLDVAKTPELAMIGLITEMKIRHNDLLERQWQKVPQAPFKGRGWPKLAMKRIIRMAAEEGFDQVAWITGDQANVRNSVATYVETLTYDPFTGTLFAMGKPGVGDRTITMAESEFDGAMGEGLAQQLRDEIQAVKDFYDIIVNEETGRYEIVDGNAEYVRDSSGDCRTHRTSCGPSSTIWTCCRRLTSPSLRPLARASNGSRISTTKSSLTSPEMQLASWTKRPR